MNVANVCRSVLKSFLVTCLLTGVLLGASFDCAKARSKVEKAICADPELSKLDEQLAVAYNNARASHPLYDQGRCIHRQRHLDALEYVNSRGIVIEQPEHEWFAWKAADSFLHEHTRYIRISSVAYKLYGWDVMTSVLIHEFGHCDLFSEGMNEGASWEANLDLEKLANERGVAIVPSRLIPEDYQLHREFVLNSYLERDWTEEKCRSAWKVFQEQLV